MNILCIGVFFYLLDVREDQVLIVAVGVFSPRNLDRLKGLHRVWRSTLIFGPTAMYNRFCRGTLFKKIVPGRTTSCCSVVHGNQFLVGGVVVCSSGIFNRRNGLYRVWRCNHYFESEKPSYSPRTDCHVGTTDCAEGYGFKKSFTTAQLVVLLTSSNWSWKVFHDQW